MMGEKIEVGEYIRTKNGQIDIFEEIDENYMFIRCKRKTYWIFDIVKHSKNIIDLIEVGDIVYTYDVLNYDVIYIYDDEMLKAVKQDIEQGIKIKKIWTKEQLKYIEYNIN